MKLKNSTDFDDKFLRRMVSWCCKELDMPVKTVQSATFTNTKRIWRGRAFIERKAILCRVGAMLEPRTDNRPGMDGVTLADRLEVLVYLTAHELYHLAAEWVPHHKQRTRRGYSGSGEAITRSVGKRVMLAFRESRDRLLAEWSEKPADESLEPSNKFDGVPVVRAFVKERADKAAKLLTVWERKLKLAKSKVRKYRSKVRYYENKTQAATKGMT